MDEYFWNLWCCFCGGPCEDARKGWLSEAVEDWYIPEKGELSFTPPPAPTKDIVTLSEEDVKFWSEVVCVGPLWDSFVSTRGTVVGNFGTIALADYRMDYGYIEHPTLILHPHCLSFLCRRINTSPKQIWSSLYSTRSDYYELQRTSNGRLNWLEYYNIDGLHSDYYHYCVEIAPKKDKWDKWGKEEGEENDEWYPDSMEALQWLLARPTVFPVVASLTSSVTFTTSPLTPQVPCIEVFNIPELFNIIIDCIIGQETSQAELAKELQSRETFTSHSVIQTTKTIFALLQVNRSLYTTILRDRQTIFLRLAWMHGWMLPFTPEDWNNWPNGTSFHNGMVFRAGENQDWRAYLLTFLRKENVHVRNRWRFHKMAMQFAFRLKVGELEFRPEVKRGFEPWFWEKGGSRRQEGRS